MAAETLIGKTFVELADTLVEGYDIIEFLHRLTEGCVSVLGVNEAGVVIAGEGGELRVLASSSERMRTIELIEVQRQDGPCLDAWRTGDVIREDDLKQNAERWPHFGPAALESGFLSAYAVPMRLRNERIGALNLFSERPNGLSENDGAIAQALADVATIGILHERFLREHEALAEQLQSALTTRVILEQAKGVVAEQAGVDMDEAFARLRNYSRSHNQRLTTVCQDMIERKLSAKDLSS